MRSGDAAARVAILRALRAETRENGRFRDQPPHLQKTYKKRVLEASGLQPEDAEKVATELFAELQALGEEGLLLLLVDSTARRR